MTSALELAARLRRREISSVELVRAALDTIRARDHELGAFVEVAARRALHAARRADAQIARGVTAPFLGVPTAIKDHEPVRGLGTRLGSRAFRWLVSPIDGQVARTCRRAGFVIVGKTTCSALTILPFIDVGLHAPTRNPHDPSRYGGGSSGGAAVAVASGMLPIAPGSDGGGFDPDPGRALRARRVQDRPRRDPEPVRPARRGRDQRARSSRDHRS